MYKGVWESCSHTSVSVAEQLSSGKVTLGLSLHCPCVIDEVVYGLNVQREGDGYLMPKRTLICCIFLSTLLTEFLFTTVLISTHEFAVIMHSVASICLFVEFVLLSTLKALTYKARKFIL